MKLTKSTLKNIIKEELQLIFKEVLKEAPPAQRGISMRPEPAEREQPAQRRGLEPGALKIEQRVANNEQSIALLEKYLDILWQHVQPPRPHAPEQPWPEKEPE